MVLEWWMILTIGIFWIVSILSYGNQDQENWRNFTQSDDKEEE
jgi:hypothetical protein